MVGRICLCGALYQQFEGKGKILLFLSFQRGSYPQALHLLSTGISTYIVVFPDKAPYIVLKSLGGSVSF
jgi:hypothetical protein